jgi:hypothetical protein
VLRKGAAKYRNVLVGPDLELRSWRFYPGLDLLAEDETDARCRVFLVQEGADGRVEGVEHFGGEGADVVEV